MATCLRATAHPVDGEPGASLRSTGQGRSNQEGRGRACGRTTPGVALFLYLFAVEQVPMFPFFGWEHSFHP
jgi:hypothetical protein